MIFPHAPETSEQISEKMRAEVTEELELVEEEPEITLTEEQAITTIIGQRKL